MTPELLTLRGATYRQEFGSLDDALWEAACWGCIRTLAWFPTISELRAQVEQHQRERAAATVIERRTEETREEGRRLAIEGLALVKAAVKEAERMLPPAPAHVLPEPEPLAVLSDERHDELQRQKVAILETPAAPAQEE